MKIKVSELEDPAIDWAVAKAKGWDTGFFFFEGDKHWNFPIVTRHIGRPDLAQDIIEAEKIGTQWFEMRSRWFAVKHGNPTTGRYGPTLLIAAMRCYVASKLGDEIDVPEELL